MAGKPGTWAKGQKVVKAVDLTDSTTAQGVAIVDADGVQITSFGGSAGLTDAQLRATPVPVSGTVTTGGLTDAQLRALAVPVSAAALPLPSGAATSALQTQPGVDIGDVTVNNAAGASAVNIQDGGNTITVDGTVGVSGSVAVTGPLTDAQLRAAVVPVSLSSTTVTGTVATLETRPSTATLANVTGTGASVVLQASNANRRALTIFNDSAVTAYVKFGSAASSSSFTVKMVDQAYYELPTPVYTGVVEALWASGSIRVTEVT